MSTPNISPAPDEATSQLNTDATSRGDGQLPAKGWRPFSFNNLILLLTATVTAALLASVITIHIINGRNSTIIHRTEENHFVSAQIFGYQYLPTLLAVIFGIWISVLDLDVKRLNPWSRLSRGSSSAIFCLYDTDFVLTVIYKSFRAG